MTDYRAIWDGLSRKQQDTLLRAGAYGFKIRSPLPDPTYKNHLGLHSHENYLSLVEIGLFEITTRNDTFVIYTLTDQGAEVLKAMPDDLQRPVPEHPLAHMWPLPRDIARIKERLKTRNLRKFLKRYRGFL